MSCTKLDQRNFPEVMRVKSAQHPKLVIVNRNQRYLDLYILKFTYFIHSFYTLPFYMFLIKPNLADSTQGHVEVPGGSVTVCAWGHHFTLCKKGVIRASTLASPFRAAISAQLARHMCSISHQNKSWHHWSVMWWQPNDVRDFGWWHLHQY